MGKKKILRRIKELAISIDRSIDDDDDDFFDARIIYCISRDDPLMMGKS